MIIYLIYAVIYFVIMFSIGFYYFKKIKSADGYLIASWNMGFWSIVGTTISTNIGAAVFIGWVGMGFTVGMSGYFKFALPAYVTSILLILIFSKPLRRQRLYTIADLFSERFGPRIGIIPSVLSAVIYSIPATALQIIGMSTVFNLAFGLDVRAGIALSFILILGFTILGGLVAAIVTDALQSVVLIVGVFILAFSALKFGGGISNVMANTPTEFLTPAGADGFGEVLMFALSIAPFYLVWQSTWQRIFASKTEEIAIGAGVLGYVITLLVSILPFGIGVIARQFVPKDIHPDLIFSYVTVELLPPAIGGIVLIGLLAALMTGANSFILQGSSNLTQDLYHKLINPKAENWQRMLIARLSVILISAAALIVAYLMTDIITVYQWSLRLTGATLVFPFFGVMFWKMTTAKGIVWSMVVAGIVTIVWPFFNTGLDQVVPGLLTSIIVLIVVSWLTNHSKAEVVKAVYWENLPSSERNMDS